jgi:acyl-CoA thioesterase I
MNVSRIRSFRGCVLAVVAIGLVHGGCERESSAPHPTALAEVDAAQTPSSSTSDSSRGGGPTPGAPGQERTRTIVAFGDSLTAGYGVASGDSYPARLQRRLDELGYRYRVVNAGVSGDTTAGGLRRVSWVLNGHPDLVILELGGNDGLRGLDIDQTRANLEGIILRLKQAGVITVLAGMKLPPNYGRDYTTRFESMYRDLATQHDLPLIPFLLDGVGGDRTLNQPDGIHPTGEGYRIVVDNVLETLKPLLNRPGADGGQPGKKGPISAAPTGERDGEALMGRDSR